MSTTFDPLDQVRAYAPPALDSAATDSALLARVLAEVDVAEPRARGRRLGLAAGVAVVALGGMTTAAAAAGVTPRHAWNELFGATAPTTSRYQADPATAHKVLSVPGPDGQEFAAWTVSNDVGWRCISTTFEPVGTSPAPDSVVHGRTGGSCILAQPLPAGLFVDGDEQSTPGRDDRLTFAYEAGDATRAELRVAAVGAPATTVPVTVSGGWLGGWFTRDQVPLGAEATVVAFGADGRELGHRVVVDQGGCVDAAGC